MTLSQSAGAAPTPRWHRSRITNKPTRRINQNTRLGRRTIDLYRALLSQMGEPTDPISQARALEAAELTVAAEVQRLAAARGEPVDLNGLVRLSNLADRATKRLGLKPTRPSSTHWLRGGA